MSYEISSIQSLSLKSPEAATQTYEVEKMKTRTKFWFIATVSILCWSYTNRSTTPAKEPAKNKAANSTGVYELTDAELYKIEQRFSRRRDRLRLECREQGREVPKFQDINESLFWQLNQIFHDTSLNISGRWQEVFSQ